MISSLYKVGDKVKCLKDYSQIMFAPWAPRKGDWFTVKEIDINPMGEVFFKLEELPLIEWWSERNFSLMDIEIVEPVSEVVTNVNLEPNCRHIPKLYDDGFRTKYYYCTKCDKNL